MDKVERIRSLTEEEAKERLYITLDLITDFRKQNPPMLTSTWDLLNKVEATILGQEIQPSISNVKVEPLDHVIVSCDASIKKNPGGPSSVGYVIEYKNEKPLKFSRRTGSTTNNQAEYDAVYSGLTHLVDLKNNPGCEVEVRTDSKLVVDQLNGKMKCEKPELARRRDAILDLVKSLPFPVSFQWRPRNSTPALEEANFLAQDQLGVARH